MRSARSCGWTDRAARRRSLRPRARMPFRDYHPMARIAVGAEDQERDLWLWDLARATLTRLTVDPG